MKTIKKLSVIAFVLILTTICCSIPSTFSWYSHNADAEGKKINYHDNLPVSIKSDDTSGLGLVSVKTYTSDENGVATTNEVTAINVPKNVSKPNVIQYYKTVMTNSGSNDVMVDFNVKALPNNADFYIGTTSPTVNQKAYASRPIRTKTAYDKVRVYFKPHDDMLSYWAVDDGSLDVEHEVGSSNETTNDINIAYKVNGTETKAMMTKCTNEDTDTSGSVTTTGLVSKKVYWFDLPSNTESFYFFNHWYQKSDSNREWNRTIDITDLTAGKMYYLTGGKVDEKYKEYAVKSVNTNLVAVNSRYTYVRMSLGNSVFADIGLKKTKDNDEDFVPDYYGSTINYTVTSQTPASNDPEKSTVISVNRDGLITPVNSGKATITTKITGVFGDEQTLTTDVDIPESITEVPVITNVKIPAAASGDISRVEIDWYAINKSTKDDLTTGNLFFTI